MNHEVYVYETDNLHDSSVIDHFWKFISRKLLSFEKWFTTHFLPLGHRKNMSALVFLFSTLLVKNFHAEHLGRFFKEHPLVLKENLWGCQDIDGPPPLLDVFCSFPKVEICFFMYMLILPKYFYFTQQQRNIILDFFYV